MKSTMIVNRVLLALRVQKVLHSMILEGRQSGAPYFLYAALRV
jgi:hypothetical protein